MPPINTQGSRAGLVTGLVIMSIVCITSLVFAIYFNTQLRATEQAFENYKKNYNGVVSDTAFTTPDFTALQALKSDPAGGFSNDTVLDIALKQRNDLTEAITGAPGDAAAAVKAANDVVTSKDTTSKLNAAHVALPKGLAADVTALVNAIGAQQAQIAKLNDDMKSAEAKLAAANANIAAQGAVNAKALEDARAAASADLAQREQQLQANQATLAKLQQDALDAAKKGNDASQATQVQFADQSKSLQKANDLVKSLQVKLGNRRVDVTNAAIRNADGRIVRLPGSNICYINLGQGDQVTPGLTFEVYDASQGVPGIPDGATGDEQLPVGKASIEITRVGATSSECRIVRTSPGAVLSEGDIIENLVYDPNVKYNFFVYGSFDLANTGRPTPADGEVIKRLISQWGGKVGDKVNVDTDFVVLGKEPVLPNYTKEELDQPLNADKLAKAQAELEKYQEVVQTARDLHIPVLNQNRFLYYVGYYDQAKR